MPDLAILLNPHDDVATALVPLQAGQTVQVALDDKESSVTYTTELRETIQFGHKYALRNIARGEAILKYGLPIGNALEEIPAGAWVHVHNCRSVHFGHRHKKYGIKA
jgi:hypothetical protein